MSLPRECDIDLTEIRILLSFAKFYYFSKLQVCEHQLVD